MLTGKTYKYTPEERKELVSQHNAEREEFEDQNMGNFKLIYPTGYHPDPYKKFLKYSRSVWEEFNYGVKPQISRKKKKRVSHKRATSYSTVQKKAIAQLAKGADPDSVNQEALQELKRKQMFGQLKKKDEKFITKILDKQAQKQLEAKKPSTKDDSRKKEGRKARLVRQESKRDKDKNSQTREAPIDESSTGLADISETSKNSFRQAKKKTRKKSAKKRRPEG